MKAVCIVQARIGSTRLPGKVLLPLNGHTVIGEVLTRCKRIPGVDEVVCAIPALDCGGPLETEAAKYCSVFGGYLTDVLSRYLGAAVVHEADIIMRITGDCPLISPELCADVLKARGESDADYASNIMPRTFPKGFDCEVFTMGLLRDADTHTPQHEREHVTPWMQRSAPKRANVANKWQLDGRLTLDTWDDYAVICAAFGHEADQRLRAA